MKPFLLWGALLGSLPGLAGAAVPSDEYFVVHQVYAQLACPSSPAVQARAVTRCLDQQLSQADQDVRGLYAKLSQLLDRRKPAPGQQPLGQLLARSQQDWLQWRESTCAFESLPAAGTPNHLNQIKICLVMYTRERAAYLRWYLQQPPADGQAQKPAP